MADIDPELLNRLKSLTEEEVPLIVRTSEDPAVAAEKLSSRGVTVRHTYDLVRALAVSAPANVAVNLLDESWVTAIEEDHTVRTAG